MDAKIRRKLREDLTLSLEDTGKIFGLSRNPTYSACKAGLIPSIRIGKKIIVPTSGIRKMLGMVETDTK